MVRLDQQNGMIEFLLLDGHGDWRYSRSSNHDSGYDKVLLYRHRGYGTHIANVARGISSWVSTKCVEVRIMLCARSFLKKANFWRRSSP